LQNGNFDSTTAGWTPSFGVTVSRSTNDTAGNVQSGSLDVVLTGGDPTRVTQAGAFQCLAATPGATVQLQAAVLIPTASSGAGLLGLLFYGSTDCSGATAGTFASSASANNSWQTIKASTAVPSGVHSMAVQLEVLKPYGQDSSEALFDAVAVTSP
jgi:hypothetical protein